MLTGNEKSKEIQRRFLFRTRGNGKKVRRTVKQHEYKKEGLSQGWGYTKKKTEGIWARYVKKEEDWGKQRKN